MKKYFINLYDFGLINVSDIEVSEKDFFRIVDALCEDFEVLCCDNPKCSHYFFYDFYGCLNQFGYIEGGCDCE